MTFGDLLTAWLFKQRWFAGKGRTVHDLRAVNPTPRRICLRVWMCVHACTWLSVELAVREPARTYI